MQNSSEQLGRAIEALSEQDGRVREQMDTLRRTMERGQEGALGKMRDVLVVAKDKLAEQDALLKQLTSDPLTHAVVLSAPNGNSNPRPEDFKRGLRVKIKKTSEFFRDNPNVPGTVMGPSHRTGWVHVTFDNGDDDHYYRTGARDNYGDRQDCDLEVIQGASSLVVLTEGKQLEVQYPDGKKVEAGDIVKLSMKTKQIVDVVQNPIVVGETCLVKRIISVKHGIVEVDHNGTSRVVASGKFKGSIEEGDRVLLDSSYSIVLINHRKPAPRFTFTETTNVTWDDIGGLAEAKQSMIEAIEFPIIHAEQYGFYGKKPIKGAMLYGPPGCGKTMLAKATATSLSKLHKGASAKTGFIYVKGPEILDKFVGVAEANVRGLFQQARKHKQEHGYPALIFIDEADAILGIRGSGISSDIERTVVPMFLAEMDGLDDSGAIVLLSTNRPDTLDPAIVRDGRIDRKIKVTRPDAESVVDVFKLHLRGVPFHNGYSTEDVAVAGRNALFAEEKKLFEIHVVNGHERVLPLKLGHICNGAMVAGIVDQATSIALHRDIKKGGKPGGVTLQDMAQAVDRVYEQNLDIDHKDAIAEMVQDFRDDVRRVTKVCRQGNTAQGVRQ